MDDRVGSERGEAVGRLADAPQQRRQPPDHGHEAVHRDVGEREELAQAFGLHQRAADADEVDGDPGPLADLAHQPCAELVA